jgi:hypothetical protein
MTQPAASGNDPKDHNQDTNVEIVLEYHDKAPIHQNEERAKRPETPFASRQKISAKLLHRQSENSSPAKNSLDKSPNDSSLEDKLDQNRFVLTQTRVLRDH